MIEVPRLWGPAAEFGGRIELGDDLHPVKVDVPA